MKKLPILALAAGLTFAPAAPALATPAPVPPLADHMDDEQDGMWTKLESWLNTWHDAQHQSPAPEPTGEPTTEPTEDPTAEPTPEPTETATPEPTGPRVVESFAAATSENTMLFRGKVAGFPADQEFTFRSSAYELTDQAGYPVQGTADADGNLELQAEDFNDTDPRYWQLEVGGTTWEHGEVIAEGELSDLTDAPIEEPIPTPAPSEPAEEPGTTGDTTGGTGGEFTDRTFETFSANGITSEAHIYAEGIDTSQPVGLLMYADGSGGFGFDSPTSSYLIGGSNGLAAVAQKHNMILVVPEAPAPGCPSDNCWYNSSGTPSAADKAAWSAALMDDVKGSYDIDTDRIVTGGYSSGAQWHRWFLPNHAEAQSVDLAVMIAYGGAPAVPANFSDPYKDELTLVWNTGTADAAYSTASYGARGGYQWYTDAGFNTEATWPEGVGHGRSGEFGGIVDTAITQHLN